MYVPRILANFGKDEKEKGEENRKEMANGWLH
jgi:hypothetical protein